MTRPDSGDAMPDRIVREAPMPQQWGAPTAITVSSSGKMIWLKFREGRALVLSSDSRIQAVWVE